MDAKAFVSLALRNPANDAILTALDALQLPDAWLVSGCLVQSAWNALTDRPMGYGISDYDVFYFDADTSWEAEDRIIRELDPVARQLAVPVQVRNQARVHLWYQQKFGRPYHRLHVRPRASIAFSRAIPRSAFGAVDATTKSTRQTASTTLRGS